MKNYYTKVRSNAGACIDDMYDYLAPLLKKTPSTVILHVGTNDSPDKTAEQIIVELYNLKEHIETIIPNVRVIISTPIIRFDNKDANTTLVKVNEMLSQTLSSFEIIDNSNINDATYLGVKRLHLNQKGTGRLAANFINFLQRV